MSYEFKTKISNKSNYGSMRSVSKIKYIVIHYTANDGDSDEGNGNYFKNNIVKASAHYFVDSNSVTQSVPDNYVAWSVGGSKYASCKTTGGGSHYGKCTNTNSISIELCDDMRNGVIYPSHKTIENAIELTKFLMIEYNIPKTNVIRHFDVVGKLCPAYWCGNAKNNELWVTEFLNKLDAPSVVFTETLTKLIGKINVDNLNIRKQPSTNYEVIGQHKTDDEVVISAITDNGWYMVDYPNIGTGYIYGYYVTTSEIAPSEEHTEVLPPPLLEKPEEVILDNTPNEWAKDTVENFISNGILKGDDMGNYKLHNNCTRQEIIVFLYRAFNNFN